jgi:hypothetical protein
MSLVGREELSISSSEEHTVLGHPGEALACSETEELQRKKAGVTGGWRSCRQFDPVGQRPQECLPPTYSWIPPGLSSRDGKQNNRVSLLAHDRPHNPCVPVAQELQTEASSSCKGSAPPPTDPERPALAPPLYSSTWALTIRWP